MGKKIVSIYPDYCSSGIWDNSGANMAKSEINMDSITQVALKYWHWVWERWELVIGKRIAPSKPWLIEIYAMWYEDGKIITQAIQEQNPELEIQYKADTPEKLIKYFYGEEENV